MSLLITGASGFIGCHLMAGMNFSANPVSLSDSGWRQKLASCKPSAIVHLAALNHSRGSDEEIWNANVGQTEALGQEAVRGGVKRFIFLSSIHAVAENSAGGQKISSKTSAVSLGVYGKSKLEAERLLQRFSKKSGMEVVIIRPPLVYGQGVKQNLRKILKLIDKRIPMPLSAFDLNLRSFVSVSNLVDLILLCLRHPAAANQTFHISDDEDISTAELLRRMGVALGKPVRNIPIPQSILRTGLRLVGKGEWVNKLCGDLRVDISETKRLLGWKPKVTMKKELQRTAEWWKAEN